MAPAAIAASLSDLWFPRIVADVDDCFVKVARVAGTFPWHSHDTEDELFYVLKGRLRIEMTDRAEVDLAQGIRDNRSHPIHR